MAKAKSHQPAANRRREQRRSQPSTSQSNQRQPRSSGRKRIRPKWQPWITVGGVLLSIAVIIGIFLYLSHQSTGVATHPTPAGPAVLQAVTNVNPTVLAAVGTGGVQNTPHPLHNQPPLKGPTGKTEFFYFGAEFCPYCAAERWAVVVALSRFGTFGNLDQTTSAADDVYPSTPTFTFYQSSYSSSYVDFVSVESETNQRDSSGNYATLQTPLPSISSSSPPMMLPHTSVLMLKGVSHSSISQTST